MDGIRDGIPIGLGYLVVSFTLGITAKHGIFSAKFCALSESLSPKKNMDSIFP